MVERPLMLESHKVYSYQDYRNFLKDVFKARKSLKPGFSIRAAATRLGFKSPSHLVMILQGKRRFPLWALTPLSKVLKMSASESRYLENLIYYNHAKSIEEKNLYGDRLKKLNPGEGFSFIDLESFRTISDPLHFTILEMTLLRGFKKDALWLQRRLCAPYTLLQIQDAVSRLEAMGLLKGNQKTSARVATPTNIASEAIKSFHRKSIAMAINSLDEQDVSDRDITSSIVSIDKEKLSEAKALIKEFRDSFCKFLETSSNSANETYQINIQFFALTKNLKGAEK